MGFQMNNNGPGKIIGITCLSIIAFAYLGGSVISGLFTGNFSSAIFPILLIGLIIFLSVRSRRKKDGEEPRPIYTLPPTVNTPVQAASAPARTATVAPSSSSSTGVLINPICNHKFREETVSAKPVVVCDCGNQFESANLIKFNKLTAQMEKLSTQLDDLEAQMRDYTRTNYGTATQAAQTVTTPKPVAAPPKPVAPPVQKPKISFSLQQWLIIGASLLVLVAGSVFVSTYVNVLDQWIFFAVTSLLSAGMAFASFATRKISGIIASFLAAFSVAMQIATMSIVGDQISNGQSWDFRWDGAPAWWWMITLFVITGISTLLAKYSSVFGFKGLALLGATGGSLLLGLAVIRELVPGNWSPLNLAIMALAAVGLAYLSKYLRSIPALEPTDSKYKEYAKSVAKREDNSILTFTRIAALIEVVAGLGLAINSLSSVASAGHFTPNPISMLIFALVIAGFGLTAKQWSTQFSTDGKELPRLLPISSGIAYVSLAVSVLTFITDYTNAWVSALLALIAIFAQAWFSSALKQLKPVSVLITVTAYVTSGLWLLNSIFIDKDSTLDQTAWFVIGLALVVTLINKRFSVYTNSWVSVVLGAAGAVTLFTNFKSSTEIASTSIGYAVIASLVLVAPLVIIALRYVLQAKKDDVDLTGEAWLATAASAILGILASLPNFQETDRDVNLLLGLAFAFIFYAAVAYLLTRFIKVGQNILLAHHYLGQALSVVVVATTANSFDMINSPRLFYTAVVAGLIVLNYTIGAVEKQAFKLHIGYVLMIGAFFINMWGVEAKWLVTVSAVQFLAIALLTYIHYLMLSKRTDSSGSTRLKTVLLGVVGSLLFGLAAQWNSWTNIKVASGKDAFLVLIMLALLSAVSLVLARRKKISDAAKDILSWISFSYAAFGVVTSVAYVAIARELDSRSYVALALVFLAVFTRLKNSKSENQPLVVLFFASNLVAAGLLGSLAQTNFNLGFIPEFYSVIISLALIVSALLSGDALGALRSRLLIEVPVIGSAALSLGYAIAGPDTGLPANLREILASAVIAGLAFFRLKQNPLVGWMVTGFLATIGSAVALAYTIQTQVDLPFTPEFYSLFLSIAFIVSTLLSGKMTGKFRSTLLVDVPVLGSAALSLIYALVGPDNGLNANLREVLGTALISGFALFRLRKNPVQGWIVTSYAATSGFALSLAYTISKNWISYNGPEIYSVLSALAILGVHQVALKHLKLKTTLFSWGFPIGVALLPSTFFTYTAWGVSFADLGLDQISREVITILVSIALLTLGLRRGNLANASMGIAGLALLVVPAVASQSDGLGSAWQVQNTAMVVGILIFAILAIARLGGKITGTSRLFLGIPITITLAPALFNALVALAKPELQPLDWWRFGIVLIVALTMLVLGTMREVAGLFYPGLIGVLLTALPYGFKQTQKDQWFLWVLLLLIAGVMVWLALRLERMRKAGRTSSAWLRELK